MRIRIEILLGSKIIRTKRLPAAFRICSNFVTLTTQGLFILLSGHGIRRKKKEEKALSLAPKVVRVLLRFQARLGFLRKLLDYLNPLVAKHSRT